MERTFTLAEGGTLHARPAALLVQTVNRFPETHVFVRKGEKEVSARSLISVLSLGAAAGDSITIRCDGGQANEAMDAIAALLTGGKGAGV